MSETVILFLIGGCYTALGGAFLYLSRSDMSIWEEIGKMNQRFEKFAEDTVRGDDIARIEARLKEIGDRSHLLSNTLHEVLSTVNFLMDVKKQELAERPSYLPPRNRV